MKIVQLQQQQNIKKAKVEKVLKATNGSPHKDEKDEKKTTKGSSIQDGKKIFEWLLNPIPVDEFFRLNCCNCFRIDLINAFNYSKYWEKKPKFIKRGYARDFYGSLLTTEMIDKMFRENYLEYTKNVDVTSYKEGVRETHNPEGRAVNFDHSRSAD